MRVEQTFNKGKIFIWTEPAKRSIGMGFQSYPHCPQKSICGNPTFGVKNAKIYVIHHQAKAMTLAERIPVHSEGQTDLNSGETFNIGFDPTRLQLFGVDSELRL